MLQSHKSTTVIIISVLCIYLCYAKMAVQNADQKYTARKTSATAPLCMFQCSINKWWSINMGLTRPVVWGYESSQQKHQLNHIPVEPFNSKVTIHKVVALTMCQRDWK